MPTWIMALLKWGGIALALVSVVALAYVEWIAPGAAPAQGAAPEPSTAPVTLYVVLLVIGVIAAIAGFALARPKE